jgi:glycine dehydrogenase subunit 2
MNEQLIFEKSKHGKRGMDFAPLDVPEQELDHLFPAEFLRDDWQGMPELTEPEVVRHFTRLSQMNYSIDTGMYPLGCCTMKYNPRPHEDFARLPGFALLHPLAPAQDAQGALALMWELEQLLCEITGMHATTLAPAAGAHGELTGMLIIRAALEARGERRTKVLIPDSAHGTNPASAVFCGYTPVEIKTGKRGVLDVDIVAQAMNEDVAAIMLTNPNTLGLFEKDIRAIADVVHAKGGFVYCDGANLNALLGVARPGDMEVDVLQMNLHKTFSTPHGGGGPGAGPVGVSKKLAQFLPNPRVRKQGKRFVVAKANPRSIGRIRSFYGSFLVLLRAYAYIRTYGNTLREIAETAVLNANYILASLRDVYYAPYPDGCMHECILTDLHQRTYGVQTLDIAKRLLDYGFHPPTMYFPLIVEHPLLIEPTETESLDTLDEFIAAMRAIAQEARENPALLHGAPHITHVRRLDEATAARQPNLRWQPSQNA